MKDRILEQMVGRNNHKTQPLWKGQRHERMGSEIVVEEPIGVSSSDRVKSEPYTLGYKEWALLQKVRKEIL